MQARATTGQLATTQRILCHYELEGRLTVGRMLNGHRGFSENAARRAGRIRGFIATGSSTCGIRAMSVCLSDDGFVSCEGGAENANYQVRAYKPTQGRVGRETRCRDQSVGTAEKKRG